MLDPDHKNIIPLSTPFINGNEWQYLKECLDTGWVSSAGSYVTRFEETVADYLGVRHAVATVSGTAALHVSLAAAGVQANDEVVVPTLTFVASVNVVRYCNAFPVFMDCDPDTLCVDVEKIIAFLKNNCDRSENGLYNKKSGRRIKAIIPVHIFGHPVDLDNLINICNRSHIDIIEDATESLGSEYKGFKTGTLGRIGCLSFNGNKIITTGGGGMVVTDDKSLADRMRHLTTQARTDAFEYDHDLIGYNYRLPNINAALGVAQMEQLDSFLTRKRKNAQLYRELLSGLDAVEFLFEKPWASNNFWFYTIKVPGRDKNPLMDYLLSQNIQVRPIWKLIHTLPLYREYEAYCIDQAEEVYAQCINLPCSVNLKTKDIEYISKHITKYFE